MQNAIYIAELALLACFLLSSITHIVGFGCLYLRAPTSLLEILFIVINGVLSVLLLLDGTEKQQMQVFGSKTLTMMLLVIVRVQISQVHLN